MSFASASIPVGATFAPTGGTATSLLSLGRVGSSESFLVNDSSAFISRKLVNANVTEPRVNASSPNGYTQRRARVNIQVPITLANGKTTTNSITMELACDPETSNAQVDALHSLAINILNDSDFDAFWYSNALG